MVGRSSKVAHSNTVARSNTVAHSVGAGAASRLGALSVAAHSTRAQQEKQAILHTDAATLELASAAQH